MGWKQKLRLTDLPAEERMEITCRRCGKSRYERAGDLISTLPGARNLHLDEVEWRLRCKDRFCKGRVRLMRIHGRKLEGFVGGMA